MHFFAVRAQLLTVFGSHGFSAALGKLGSIIAQIFLAYAKFGGMGVNDSHSVWLGWVLMIFTIWMVVGVLVTRYWMPNPSNIWGQSRTLEDLAGGKSQRRRYEKQEREAWASMIPGSPEGLTPTAFPAGGGVGRSFMG